MADQERGTTYRINRILDALAEDPNTRVPQILGRAAGIAHDARMPSTTRVIGGPMELINFLEEAAVVCGFQLER